ncbi:MAG: LiaF-related protein [Firmicutes bacterium]|nr:LiaF-related protein [Bacillota bacterium]
MKERRNIIWGIILIVIGLALAGNIFNLFRIHIFFDGWWTLFIIIPSIIGITNEGPKTGNIISLIVGILLFLACRGLFDFAIIWKLLLPIIIVGIGISMIFKDVFNKEVSEKITSLNKNMGSDNDFAATFSGQDINFDGENFKGANLNAVFGSLKMDISDAIIEDDVVINATSIFGGIDIFVPKGYKVKIKSNSIFGGVSNNKKNSADNDAHVIYINATCMFGGVEIK